MPAKTPPTRHRLRLVVLNDSPPVLLLPTLPADLEYRLVGRNLALIDVRANIVVDVLRGAVPLY